MSYVITISGHAESAKAEAEVLDSAADLAEKIGANGAFSFVGNHHSVSSAPAADGVAKAREVVAAYNAAADADDRTEAS